MSKKPIIDELKLGVNPLTMSLEVKVRQIKTTESLLSEYTEGVHLPIGKIDKSYVLENVAFTKVYHSAFWRDIVVDLTPKALQVWVYITFDLEQGKDYYWINTTYLVSKLKLKNKRELTELIDNQLVRYGLLSKTIIDDVYWINPTIVFCGNRIKKYPNNIKMV